MDLSKYKPGQRIVSMSRGRFLSLWASMKDGSLLAEWPEGREAQTKKERTQVKQINAIAMLHKDYPEKFKELLESTMWREFEITLCKDGVMRMRALMDTRIAIHELVQKNRLR